MPRRSRILQLASAITLSSALVCAHAVELGDVAVRSHIGQPLVADIELTGFSAADSPVEVRMARQDVYQGANISMSPVLSGVRMSVMRRDGRQFLHITSLAAVNVQYIHLFVELSDAGRRNIRAATLWLTPDPKPAAPAPVPAAAAAVAAAAPKPEPVAALPVRPAPVRAAPVAPAVPVRVAPKLAAAVAPPPAAAAAAACPKPRYSDEEVRACAARDYKNAVLTAQIVELEEKVKALQASLDPVPAVRPPAPAHIEAVAMPVRLEAVPPQAKPAVPPPIRVARSKPASEPAPAPGGTDFMPRWAWNLIALLAAGGAVAAVVVRRRKNRVEAPSVPEKSPGKLMGRLKEAMQRDKSAAKKEPALQEM
ncbi:MAG: type IV pilus assembly protein FimV [Telluria sp.]